MQADCSETLRLVLAAVAGTGWTPVHVWINSGQLCPFVEGLFDPNQNFPYPLPPAGGQWIGNAEVAFAETDKHAGFNVARAAMGVIPVLIGYRVPLLTWCSGRGTR